jgi:serine/threonine protein kinase
VTLETTTDGSRDDFSDDPRVLAAARDYLAELEAGRRPDRRAYEARHPDLAAELADCLDGVELAHGMAPQAATTGPLPPQLPPLLPLGDFQIVREIGRGGMGVVYEAVQLSLGRRVALKVLPFAAALDAKHLQRFRTESHAAAQLHHTNIVPVYAVGCERGTHYYAMQLIDGQPLDAVIRDAAPVSAPPNGSTVHAAAQQTRPATSTTRRATYAAAARIALQAAEALDYAHEVGVVHRDVRPANLLLDGKGVVWVTDFGLAQLTAEAGALTRTGDVFGTLRYMSPEQAAGRRGGVDHRTDVYSLGVTLYELLTGTPAFPGTDRQELLHALLHDEPPPPRAVDRHVPPELETIVLKATAKLPAERYATAGELAADLRRFLEDRPILARRPTAADRARKWLRRHPEAVRAGVVLLALGTLGSAATTAVVVREQARTADAYRHADRRATEAEERFQLARRSADEMIRLADEELADDPRLQPLRRQLLESALVYYQELIDRRRSEAAVPTADLEATTARVRAILADLAVLQGAGQHLLLQRPRVQAELQLTAAQRARIDAVTAEMDDHPGRRFAPVRVGGAGERGAAILAEIRRHEGEITSVLTPAQLARLRQLALQARGPDAFRDPELLTQLKVTPEQRERLRALDPGPRGGPPDGRPGGFRGGPGGPGGPRRGRPLDDALAVLTPAQRTRWEALTGAPFQFERDDRGDAPRFGGPSRDR